MQNRKCIVFKRTRDTQQRIHESCACLWMPGLFRLQPVVGWIHLYHTRTAVAFARWNFLLYCLRWGKIITPQNSFCLWRKILRKASIIFAQHKSSLWKWNDQHVRSVGQRKKSESPTGFEHMTSQTPGRRSIHLSYGELIENEAIY